MTLLIVAIVCAPLAAWGAYICIREPMRWALPVFAALAPYGGALSLGSSRFGSLSSLAGFVLGIGLVLRLLAGGPSAPRVSLTVPVWLLFLAGAVLTGIWSIDKTATISGVIILASLVLVYVLCVMSYVDRDILRRVENGLLVGGVSAVLYGLAQIVLLGGLPNKSAGGVDSSGQGRFGDNMLGANIEAIALLYPLVLALTRALSPAERGRRWLYGLMAAVILTGIFMTGSRGGSLATGVALVTLTFAGPRRQRRALLACCGIGVLAAAYVWIEHPGGVANRTYASATSSSGRTDIWQVGLASCPKYCAFGAGWGTFPDVYADTQALVPGAAVLVGTQGSYQPHNLWLLAVVQEGLIGLALLTLALVISIGEAVALPRSLRGPPLAALLGLMFAVFLLSSLEFKCFWIVLIMVTLNRNLHDAETRVPEDVTEISRTSPIAD